MLRGAIKALLASPTYDAVVVIVGSSGLAMPDLMADAIHDCLPGQRQACARLREPARAGSRAPAEPARRAGLRGARKLHQRARGACGKQARVEPRRADRLHACGAGAHRATCPRGSLDEAQAKQLFARFGVPCVREIVVVRSRKRPTQAARELGGAVVLKILSGEITHKSDVGGVAVNVTPTRSARA